jgi:predicted nucleic acid-binding protein
MIVLLDSSPLGLLTSTMASQASRDCNLWLRHLLEAGNLVLIPEIVDYELRRELLRGRMTRGLLNLDALALRLLFAPITSPAMRLAAEFWAAARQRGLPTADDKALDVDVILAAQAAIVAESWGQETVIATTNVRHLGRFAPAREWREVH